MNDRRPIWEGLSAEEHEYQYNPQKSVPDFAAHRAKREAPNAAARARMRVIADLSYGPGPLHTLDVYPATVSNAPVHIFIHGGYWRGQDKANFAVLAEPLVAQGVCVVVINYALCPVVTLDDVVASARDAFEWTVRHIGEHGGDPTRVTLSGHSAGAHLGAAILATDWQARGLPANPLQGAVLISGIFDPAPAVHTSVNADLHLTPEVIARHNYERQTLRLRCPVWVLAGSREPWQFIDQSYRYAQHLHRQGVDHGVVVSPGYHHFDILDQYLDPASDVMRCVLSQVHATAASQ